MLGVINMFGFLMNVARDFSMAFWVLLSYSKMINSPIKPSLAIPLLIGYSLLNHFLRLGAFSILLAVIVIIISSLTLKKRLKIISLIISLVITYGLTIISLLLGVVFGFVALAIYELPSAETMLLPSFLIVNFIWYLLNKKEKLNLAYLGELLEKRIIRTVTLIASTLFTVFLLFLLGGAFLGFENELVLSGLLLMLGATIIGSLISLVVITVKYVRSEELAKKQAENERIATDLYITEIERQSTEVRKFKHDYQNVLTSMAGYFQDNDFDGLKKYFQENISKTTDLLNEQDFEFEPLQWIRVKEVKGILVSKLISARLQEIEFILECKDEIEDISLDSVVLIRTLGIVLDNALEELATLGYGKLTVSIFKIDAAVTFVVKNTCRDNIERLHILKKAKFTTKGDHRGIGLNNLEGFSRKYPNLKVATTISDNHFIQKLTIGVD